MLIDRHGRKIDYLRVSVTERCNLRCLYCMDEKPFNWVPHENILSYEEMFLFVKIAMDRGVQKIRLTGGEPLVRPNIERFIKMIKDYKDDIDIALTTNGFLLKNMAEKLSLAGLKRVNISLDSLKRDVLHKISKVDALENVLRGIKKSLEHSLVVKLNMVPMKDINEKEILDIFEFAKSKNIMIRFIEYMENNFANSYVKGLNLEEIMNAIKTRYDFEEIPKNHSSPARLFETADKYLFGIIAPHNRDFCESCNRLRISAEGFLIPCLYFDEAISLKEAIRANDKAKVESAMDEVLRNKPKENRWQKDETNETSQRAFYHTGG